MCRIIAIPKNFPKKEALEIVSEFEKDNTDGFGYVYVRNGQFVVNKWPVPFSFLIKKGIDVFKHMPYNDGWTIAHVRAASVGANTMENTHPFISGNWAVVHNGTWADSRIARLAFGKSVKLIGATDSEVAANLIRIVGPRKFCDALDSGGNFLALNRSGDLWVLRTSYERELTSIKLNDGQYVIASEFNTTIYPWNKQHYVDRGWAQFNKNGKVRNSKKKESVVTQYAGYGGYARHGGVSQPVKAQNILQFHDTDYTGFN